MAGPAASAVASVHERMPLVHCVTNHVSMDLAANALLAVRASPAMVHAPEEAGGFAAIAGAVVINVGTIDELWLRGMRASCKGAHESGVPVVLDPVACGVPGLKMRSDFCAELCRGDEELGVPSVIRCNASEVSALSAVCAVPLAPWEAMTKEVSAWAADTAPSLLPEGATAASAAPDDAGATAAKGPDSTARWDQVLPQAVALAMETGAVVAVTGAIDVVVARESAHDCRVGLCGNGIELLTRVTAAGCALSALCGAAVATTDRPGRFRAVLGIVSAYGSAAEAAAEAVGPALGPGSFRAALLDRLYLSTPEDAGGRQRVAERSFRCA